jgi:hypothetical protein
MSDSELHCKFVSSRGMLKSCDIYDDNPRSSQITNIDITKIKKNDIVYICNSSIQYFYIHQFKHINVPFILVSGDSDEITPFEVLTTQQFEDFINSDNVLHWFATNCFLTHPKMTRIPYGLNYHVQTKELVYYNKLETSVEQEQHMLNILRNNSSNNFNNRKPLIYIDRFTIRSNERLIAYNTLSPNVSFKETEWSNNRYTIYENQTKYAFVLSPPSLDIPRRYKLRIRAGGFDCIRTWEALVLGCIPIVKSSPMDPLFEDLPVWLVNDWNEVNDAEKLKNKIEEFKNKTFKYEKLTLKYWVDLFHSKKFKT